MLGNNLTEFTIVLDNNYWVGKGSMITNGYHKMKVLETPKRKWYHLLLQYISFGWYKAGWYYKVKLL